MRMTAAVTDERGARLLIEDVDLDEPRPGELRGALVACGVCHTDAVARGGDLPFPVPGVLGHEGVGHVDAVGDAARSTPGTRIIAVEPNPGRREKATTYGATEVLDPGENENVVGTIHEICDSGRRSTAARASVW